jgi:hypothetical protein
MHRLVHTPRGDHGIEKIARKHKRPVQFAIDGADAMSFADQFYALAKLVRSV